MFLLIKQWLGSRYKTEALVEHHVPNLDGPLRFFVHPPPDLEELGKQVMAEEKAAG
jgi:hypothetical protein